MLAAVVCSFALASCEKNVEAPAPNAVQANSDARLYGESGRDYMPNKVLVKFKTSVSAAGRSAALAKASG